MLLQFNFENFKSFRDDTTLDLSATKISEFKERVRVIGNERVLPVSAIFGGNAHGKSNVIEAFRYMNDFVMKSLEFSGEYINKYNRIFMRPTPFLFDDNTINKESKFEVYFIDSSNNSKIYNYGFTVTNDGINEEWLNFKSKTSRKEMKSIFYRNNKKNILDLNGIEKNSIQNIKVALSRETLIVSLGAKLKISNLINVQEWFNKQEFADFGKPLHDLLLSSMVPKNFVEDIRVQETVVKFLSAFDDSIIGFNIDVIKANEDGQQKIIIDTKHKMVGSDKITTLPLKQESAGTLKMFSMYSMLQNVLDNGGILLIDELNSRLHPLLVRAILITFLNPEKNINNAQLIFTSHDSLQLKENGLRRDEIWFTEKNRDGVSILYSLADFFNEDGTKIRKDEDYEKNYLLGKYGAIPILKDFEF